MKCKILIYNNLVYFSTESGKHNLSFDFIDFFKYYIKDQQFTEEMEFNIRFYVFLFHSYISYLKVQDKDLNNSWDNDIKPFLIKKYSFEQSGIFNVNADIQYLIKEIDSLFKKLKKNTIPEKKKIINKVPSNDSLKDLDMISSLSGDSIKLEQEQEEFENDLEIIKINDEEELINSKYLNFENDKKNNKICGKRSESSKDIMCHSSTIASKSTAISIYDELNKKSNDKRNSFSTESISNTKYKKREMTPFFSDEFETEGVTIVHSKDIIAQISFNLFLKKIVVGNFFDDYLYYTINFVEQCFYFMKRDIVFKKIMDCYNYYTNLKVPFLQRNKLIYFMNILVIKMYECPTKLDSKDEILIKIKQFYNNIINELKPQFKKRNSFLQDIIVGGINAIKTGVNTIKDNIDKKIKNKNDNEDKKEIKKEENTINIKNNLNELLLKKQQIKEDEQNSAINIEKKDEIAIVEKEKEITPEEKVVNECEKILSLIQKEIPKQELLEETEEALYFHKLKLYYENINKNKKNNIIKKGLKTLKKSSTEKNLLSKSFKEEIHPNEINGRPPYFSCLNYEVKEIAEQLIYISKTSLNKIKRKELYNGAFLKKSKLITSPNIVENINNFNKLIFFIVEDILSYDFPKDRAKIIDKWAHVAEYCKKRKDYNDLFAINSAFKSYIIMGLDLTWKEVGYKARKIIRDLENICNFEGNYKNIREDMKSLNYNDYYTPYLGLLLKDLNFYEENCKYIINGLFINFEKINGVQKSIDEFFHFQKIKDKKKVNLNKDLSFFEKLETQTEEYLESLANKLEPKFILYINPKKIKRLTNNDKKYFKKHSGKGLLSNSMRQTHA